MSTPMVSMGAVSFSLRNGPWHKPPCFRQRPYKGC